MSAKLPSVPDGDVPCWACHGSGVVHADGIAINCPNCNPVQAQPPETSQEDTWTLHEHIADWIRRNEARKFDNSVFEQQALELFREIAALRLHPQEDWQPEDNALRGSPPTTPRLKGEPDYYAACLALIADTIDGMEPEKLEEKRHKLSAAIRMASHYVEKLRGEYDLRGSPPAHAARTTVDKPDTENNG